jgi:hypothetical protein
MNKIIAAFIALEEGNRLGNVTFWKRVQLWANALLSVIVLMPDSWLDTIGNDEGIGVIVLISAIALNLYLTAATTRKIGIKP